MLSKLRERGQGETGFTLVELLVVMLIIGLLAAIAIPAFFNQKNKANDSQAKVFARTAETAMETYSTDHNGSYAGATPTDLVNIEPTLSGANGLAVTYPAGDAYQVSVNAPTGTSGNVFMIARLTGGTTQLTCTSAGNAGCPGTGGGTGNWG